MKAKHALYLTLLLLMGCKKVSHKDVSKSNILIANKFVDAFYSFNRDSLQAILSEAIDSQPNILYYQKWAECGHYKILERSKSVAKNDSVVLFPVTVKDDLMEALEIDFHVTDTFRIIVTNGKIRLVETSSNDPDIYHEAKEWVKQNRAELIDKECEGIWNGGPTPCECIHGFLKGFEDFLKMRKATVFTSKRDELRYPKAFVNLMSSPSFMRTFLQTLNHCTTRYLTTTYEKAEYYF